MIILYQCSAVAKTGDRLATIDMGQKLGGCAPLFGRGVAGSSCNTVWPKPRPTFVPSGILIHPAVWPQQTWAENWGGLWPPLGGELGLHLAQCGLGRGIPPFHTKFRLDLSNCLATIHQRHRQTDRQTVTQDRTGQADRQTDNGPIAQGEPFYKRSPKNCR